VIGIRAAACGFSLGILEEEIDQVVFLPTTAMGCVAMYNCFFVMACPHEYFHVHDLM